MLLACMHQHISGDDKHVTTCHLAKASSGQGKFRNGMEGIVSLNVHRNEIVY